jgi:hypothetical protein
MVKYKSVFFTLVLDEDLWSASLPGCFTPRKTDFGSHLIGRWVNSRPIMDTGRNLCPYWELNPSFLWIDIVTILE